ncbi:MAG: hypothetical protein R2800_03695 [Flavipsychrobacter sp.]
MANYSILDNASAVQITQSQCDPNANYQTLKASFEAEGKVFYSDRTIAIVGVDPENPGESYTMVINPSFTDFDFATTPSHEAASIVSYFSNGVGVHVAAVANISHNPLQINSITLKEIGKTGDIVSTAVNRVALVNQTPEQIGASMSVDHLNTPSAQELSAKTGFADMGEIAAYALGTLLNDSYASGLYPTGGIDTLTQDAVVASKFSQSVSMRAGLFDLGFEVTVCTSTSSNACTSSSSTLTIEL